MSASKIKKKEGAELNLKGFPICPGVAIGKPFFFFSVEEKVPEFVIPDHEIENEVARYYRALSDSKKDLLCLTQRLKQEGGIEAAAILSSHLEIMGDPLMTTQVEEKIREKRKNPEYVFKSVMGEYENRLSNITDQFFRERAKDFQDISRRIISHLRQKERSTLRSISTKVIVFAHELSPSDTAEANTDFIEAFVTRSGAETSHVAIMARAKGIPFVANVPFPDLSFSLPPQVIVDGEKGNVIINPSKKSFSFFKKVQKKIDIHAKNLEKSASLEAETLDGHSIRIAANIESFDEVDALIQNGGGDIGLFRTEYLYLAKDSFPPEEEQFQVYKKMGEKIDGHRAIIRTFDIGGDKLGNFTLTRHEKNPNLGCRAIRLMLKEKAIFKTQIRAILRASAFGELNILLPLISGLDELREAKELIEEVKEELLKEKIPFARKIPIGCMIEVPSAALITDLIAKECDFLSIGTNDLVQYCLAVDRGNTNLRYLYTPSHPSILRLVKFVTENSSVPVSLCGEIAADPKFTPLLLGLGIHELSLSPPAIPLVKNVIRLLTLENAKKLADYTLTLSTAEEIQDVLTKFYQDLGTVRQ